LAGERRAREGLDRDREPPQRLRGQQHAAERECDVARSVEVAGERDAGETAGERDARQGAREQRERTVGARAETGVVGQPAVARPGVVVALHEPRALAGDRLEQLVGLRQPCARPRAAAFHRERRREARRHEHRGERDRRRPSRRARRQRDRRHAQLDRERDRAEAAAGGQAGDRVDLHRTADDVPGPLAAHPARIERERAAQRAAAQLCAERDPRCGPRPPRRGRRAGSSRRAAAPRW